MVFVNKYFNFWLVCILSGVGLGYMVLNGLVCIYYNVIIAIALYYLFASFTTELPWGSCGHEWNTEFCSEIVGSANATVNATGTYHLYG